MAVTRTLPYLGCNFQVRWSPGDEPPAGSGFSEVLLPPFAAGELGASGGGATRGTSPVLGEAASGTGAVAGAASTAASSSGGGSGGGSGDLTGAGTSRVVLRRGFTGSLEIYQWWNDTRLGTDKRRRTLTVDLLDGGRGSVVCTWEFANARPDQLAYSPLQALDPNVLIESLTLSFDTMTMK